MQSEQCSIPLQNRFAALSVDRSVDLTRPYGGAESNSSLHCLVQDFGAEPTSSLSQELPLQPFKDLSNHNDGGSRCGHSDGPSDGDDGGGGGSMVESNLSVVDSSKCAVCRVDREASIRERMEQMQREGYDENVRRLLRRMARAGIEGAQQLIGTDTYGALLLGHRVVPTTCVPILAPSCSGIQLLAKEEMVQCLTFGANWRHYDESGNDRRIIEPVEPRVLEAQKRYSKAVRRRNSLDRKEYRVARRAYEAYIACCMLHVACCMLHVACALHAGR